MTSIQSLGSSNDLLYRIMKFNKPFILCRPGIGGDSMVPYLFKDRGTVDKAQLYALQNNAGIYFRDDQLKHKEDVADLRHYCDTVYECYRKAALCACFPGVHSLVPTYNKFSPTQRLHNRVVEPFLMDTSLKSWTDHLEGKRVLIINPFAQLINKQCEKLELIWEKSHFKLPKSTVWITYASPMTLAGNKLDVSWKYTFDKMCHDISQLEFDIALLGCGGYGHPLCEFIFSKLHKTAIYVGGALQIWFGIKGKRWEQRDDFKCFMNKHWVYPDITPLNSNRVENACYWK